MKNIILTILFTVLLYSVSTAQILKGKITDQSGEPVQYATIYISELKEGTTSNVKGDYEIKLSAGKYKVYFQNLGYQPVYEDISLKNETVIKNVVLYMQYYQIPEVRISATGEDPAYPIMRKAIGLAPYYLNNISHYKAEVYLKGNLVINNIPRIFRKSMTISSSGNEAAISAGSKNRNEQKYLKPGDSFLMESFNEIEFNAPDKYFQRMISYHSTFPEQGNEISPMSFIQASFYQPVLADMAISPLAPNAFSHYRFKYQGASQQGNFTINKIQVIPKRKSQQLFEGTIYIIENLWCLQSVDLTNDNLVGKIRIQQIYAPVEEDVWMPVSHIFDVKIGIVGFKADAGYGSSVKYNNVTLNKTLKKPASLASLSSGKVTDIHKTDTLVSQKRKQIDRILGKEKLSNRDMIKLSRLMQKESQISLKDSSVSNNGLLENITQVVEKDAAKKDSSYWAGIRPIPLSEIEMKSVRKSDSIRAAASIRKSFKTDTVVTLNNNKRGFLKTAGDITSGHTWKTGSGMRITFNGLIDLKKLNFNSVDGFHYGIAGTISKSLKDNHSLYITPDLNWAFSREKLMWTVSSGYRINQKKKQLISLRAGITSKDINSNGGINPFLNSVTSLLQKRNYLKLYESRFFSAGYSTELANGLKVDINGNYDNRKLLQNSTNFSFLKSSELYSDNTPVNEYLSALSNPVNSLCDQQHWDFATTLTYTPFQKYRINKGVKINEGSDWPAFSLTWRHATNDFKEIVQGWRRFDMFRFEVSRHKNTGAFSELRWRIGMAGYLDNRNLTYYDFFHFNTQPLPLLINNYEDAFMIPSYYSLSTPEFHVEAHLKYTTPYLLLKFLPVLSNTLMRENITLSYLGSRYHTNYTEIGYSISEIFFLGEAGIYAGFDDLKYKNIGLRIILRFN